jgi:hypothetical protein
MSEVASIAGAEVVDTEDSVAFSQKTIGKVGAEKARSAGD